MGFSLHFKECDVYVVSASSCMELTSRFYSQLLDELFLDIKEQILVLAGIMEFFRYKLTLDLLEGRNKLLAFISADYVLLHKYYGMGIIDGHHLVIIVGLKGIENRC